jgi:hypothetical protein
LLGFELAEDRGEAVLSVSRRQVLGRRALAGARSPDDRAARSSPAGIPDVRWAKPASAAFAMLIAPVGVERSASTVPVDLDLQVSCGTDCIAHIPFDLHALETDIELRGEARLFPYDFPNGLPTSRKDRGCSN